MSVIDARQTHRNPAVSRLHLAAFCWIALGSALGVGSAARAQEAEQAPFEQPGYTLAGFSGKPQYLDLEGGLIYTDNASLAGSDKRSTGIGFGGVDMDYDHVGSEFSLSARGNVAWLQYFDNLYPGTPYGNFDGTALWGHPTDLFQWVLRDTMTEGITDPLAAPTLSELQVINFVTTGPYLNFHIASTERITVYGSFSATTYQTSPFDSKTYDGGALYVHEMSGTTNLAFQLDAAHTLFNNDVASDFTMRTAQIIYSGIFARTSAAVSAGYSTQNYAESTTGAPYVSADLSRRISSYSTLSIHARDGYTTTGAAVRSDLTGAVSAPALVGATPPTSTPGPYKDRLGSVGWSFQRARSFLSLQVGNERQQYVSGAAYNSNLTTIFGTASRQIRPTTFLVVQAYREYESYGTLDGKVTITIVNASLQRQFRKFGVSIYAQRTHQVASAPSLQLLTQGFSTSSYDEDRVGLQISYDLLGHRLSQAADTLQ